MSREVIRAVHGKLSRRVIKGIKSEPPFYVGQVTSFRLDDGTEFVVLAQDVFALKKVADHMSTKFNAKMVATAGVMHADYAVLADTGWEQQTPIGKDDYDKDDEL